MNSAYYYRGWWHTAQSVKVIEEKLGKSGIVDIDGIVSFKYRKVKSIFTGDVDIMKFQNRTEELIVVRRNT
jgi:hypothetical protein